MCSSGASFALPLKDSASRVPAEALAGLSLNVNTIALPNRGHLVYLIPNQHREEFTDTR